MYSPNFNSTYITRILKIFLKEEVVVFKMETTIVHGAITIKTQMNQTNFYSFDAIISVRV